MHARTLVALLACVIVTMNANGQSSPTAWKPAPGPLTTRWAKDVRPDKALPEYPRPQMVRKSWKNLNGLWNYAIAPRSATEWTQSSGEILVPFPIESSLSGVGKRVSPEERLWYKRFFDVPKAWAKKRVLLHFGAVDWECTVWVNGSEVGRHKGGYDSFSFDITDALKPSGLNILTVAVWDPSDAGLQPRGKQVNKPEVIWYTPTTGIWQTVWLEPVETAHIRSIHIVPDIDQGVARIRADVSMPDGAELTVSRPGAGGAAVSGPAKDEILLSIPDAKLWSPEDPHLYDITLTLTLGGKEADRVASYVGMRKISLGKDDHGRTRLCLNNKPYFMVGPLDQGFWPDGLYTAPTDAALKSDIEVTKKLGFNMARKHVKVEPDRWYYWCDKLGLIVWQDMPSGDRYIGGKDPDIVRTAESAAQFETELTRMIHNLRSHPSIVMWVPFNEGWGQFDTARIAELAKRLDPTRLVNSASGWTDRGVGDVFDWHVYPGPESPKPEPNRAAVLGEYGGLGLPLAGHTWQAKDNWGYRTFTDVPSLTEAYLKLQAKVLDLIANPGLSAAIYTQTTDVEIEVNGLMTYDREVIKLDPKVVGPANRKLHTRR